jgi:hypothetical protein
VFRNLVSVSKLALICLPLAFAQVSELAADTTPQGDAEAGSRGFFDTPFSWPIIAIHVALLPDGRVVSFGSTEDGMQGGLVFDLWNPAQGSGPFSHTTLPTLGGTDIFCAGQTLMGSSNFLITGGDLTIGGQRNYSIPNASILDWKTNSQKAIPNMKFARWYPTIVTTPNDDKVVLGGREDFEGTRSFGVATPEVLSKGVWRTLTGATNGDAYGTNWYYPRAFQASNGHILVITKAGTLYDLDPAGSGKTVLLPQTVQKSPISLPTLMYAPGKILSLRVSRRVDLIDVTGPKPVVKPGALVDRVRLWSNATVMANGEVFLNGGSTAANEDVGTSYEALIWNPLTGQWSRGATAKKMRLYHSVALLLPDATVLTAGGGAPGPVGQLNAEIYYPPYLYEKDGSGSSAPRPKIIGAPTSLNLGTRFDVTVGTGDQISRVTFVRLGSATHSLNVDQRFFQLGYSQAGPRLTVTAPTNRNFALPGYYMLFVFNQAGVPSVAAIVRVKPS